MRGKELLHYYIGVPSDAAVWTQKFPSPCCGEKVVKADGGQWIAELIRSSERIAKAPRISVPAIKFEVEGIAA